MSKTADLQTKLDAAFGHELVGNTFKHYKGGIYVVDGFVIDTDDGNVRVLYTRVDGPGFDEFEEMGIQFARPLAQWFDEVDGQPRFHRVELVKSWVAIVDGEILG